MLIVLHSWQNHTPRITRAFLVQMSGAMWYFDLLSQADNAISQHLAFKLTKKIIREDYICDLFMEKLILYHFRSKYCCVYLVRCIRMFCHNIQVVRVYWLTQQPQCDLKRCFVCWFSSYMSCWFAVLNIWFHFWFLFFF